MKKIFRIGERSSPLSLIQAEIVRTALFKAHPNLNEDYEIEFVPIRTSGDWRPGTGESTLEELGANKGLFTKEIDEALMSGHIDAAVHSMKDVATFLPQHLSITAILKRGDPREAFISYKANQLSDLPEGSTIGTSSLRRKAQILALRPDLAVVPLRGNVETRLNKLKNGAADATILALAGLQRMGLAGEDVKEIAPEVILPSAGQGAIGVITRGRDSLAEKLITPLNHVPTYACVTAERAFLAVLDGSCRTPIAALCRLASDNILILEGLVARSDGTDLLRLKASGNTGDAKKIGEDLGHEFRRKLSPECRHDLGLNEPAERTR